MSKTFTADWYDAAMTEPDAPAMLPLEESPWLQVYERLVAMIEPHEEVVDLGCGTGRFIELLRRSNHYAKTIGVDWSSSALEEASGYVSGNGLHDPSWRLEDLADWQADAERAGNTVFVCSEVLEHLPEDIDLVRRIPPGHRFLFTVPNFESESHLRIFPDVGDVWRRYSSLLTFRSWCFVGWEPKGIHVLETIRRLDAW